MRHTSYKIQTNSAGKFRVVGQVPTLINDMEGISNHWEPVSFEIHSTLEEAEVEMAELQSALQTYLSQNTWTDI